MDMPTLALSSGTINWPAFFDAVANTLLPDLLKITSQLVILPLMGMGGRMAAHALSKKYFAFLVRWAGQTVARGTEKWAENRMEMVLSAAQGKWWLRWMNKEEMTQLIEAAVAEWNKEYMAALGEKP